MDSFYKYISRQRNMCIDSPKTQGTITRAPFATLYYWCKFSYDSTTQIYTISAEYNLPNNTPFFYHEGSDVKVIDDIIRALCRDTRPSAEYNQVKEE